VILKNKINVVCIGGGSGLSHFVKAIKDIEHINLKCIVTVADNGGSSGVLKEEYNVPALGDIRNVLVALSNVQDEMSSLLDFRFDSGFLKSHSLGNIIITGAMMSSGLNLSETINNLAHVFNVNSQIIPSTNEVVDIKATYFDNSEMIGEKNISLPKKKIKKIEYLNDVEANEDAIIAINEADLIIYSIGSLYTSLMPNLIIPRINVAIKNSKAEKIFFANLMSQPGETDNYTLSMYVQAINNHLGYCGIDTIIANNKGFSDKIINKYQKKSAAPVIIDQENLDKNINVLLEDIAIVKNNKVIHDPEKIKKLFEGKILCHSREM
jgi:uncharacterized cofD-like protein